MFITRVGLAITLIAGVFAGRQFVSVLLDRLQEGRAGPIVAQITLILCVVSLIYGALVYIFARLGYLKRLATHRPATRDELDRIYEAAVPPLTIMVPSYREDPKVVRRTLLAAALQDYPNRRVVLLIDDPPTPTSREKRAHSESVRRLPRQIQSMLDEARTMFDQAYAAFVQRRTRGVWQAKEEAERLAQLYWHAAAWFDEQRGSQPTVDHNDQLLVEKVFIQPAATYCERAQQMEAIAEGESLTQTQAMREYRRLAYLFRADVTSFERKRYVNLSHKPNKAMNLNSYIALIGRSFREVRRDDGVHLEESSQLEADHYIPEADFLINLDADSLVVHDYATRLIHFMRQPGNENVAVAQTPYSTPPRPPGMVERIAGATTDIQYIIHQGFTHFDATYWVGANAVIRREALDDIAEEVSERGFKVLKFIQDRTPIEDSESTIDLVASGWRLHNYPERLAFSATPPDFGSLLVQRRRWANGGLIIFPKLLRYLLRGPRRRSKVIPGIFRTHYLVSLLTSNLALLIILAYPFEQSMRTFWLPLEAVPYFFLYTRDLVQNGYKKSDMLRVYALNVMLIPIVMGGIIRSLVQTYLGRHSVFGRTPKVGRRTNAPAIYILLVYVLLAGWMGIAVWDVLETRWFHASLCLLNAIFMAYAAVRYIGLKETGEDLSVSLAQTQRIAPARDYGFDPEIIRSRLGRPRYVAIGSAARRGPSSDIRPTTAQNAEAPTDASPAAPEMRPGAGESHSGQAGPTPPTPANTAGSDGGSPDNGEQVLVPMRVKVPRGNGQFARRTGLSSLLRRFTPALRPPLASEYRDAAIEALHRNLSCGQPEVEVKAASALLSHASSEEEEPIDMLPDPPGAAIFRGGPASGRRGPRRTGEYFAVRSDGSAGSPSTGRFRALSAAGPFTAQDTDDVALPADNGRSSKVPESGSKT